MASETTATSVTELIPTEVIEERAVASAFQKMVFEPVLGPGHSFNKTGLGAKLDIPQSGGLTFTALTEGEEEANSEFTTTDRSLTPILLGDSLLVSWQAKNRSVVNPIDLIANEAAIAWAQLTDSAATYSFAAIYTEATVTTHELGTNGTPLDAAVGRAGMAALMTSKGAPPFNWFISPAQWGELMQDSVARELLKMGEKVPSGMNGQPIDANMLYYAGELYKGLRLWVVPGGMISATGIHSMMLAQSAAGIAYENIATDLSPTLSRLNLDISWNSKARGWWVDLTVSQDVGGLAFTSTTNSWMVDIVS